MREKFVYDAEIGDNTKFVYTPKTEQKAKFVYKELNKIFRLPGQSRQAKIIQTCRLRLTKTKEKKKCARLLRNPT